MFFFGRLVFFVATGQRPLQGVKFQAMMSEMQSRSRLPEMEWPASCKLAHACREVVASCCQWVSMSRPSMRDVSTALLHPSEGRGSPADSPQQERPLSVVLEEARELQTGKSAARDTNHAMADASLHSVSSRFDGSLL